MGAGPTKPESPSDEEVVRQWLVFGSSKRAGDQGRTGVSGVRIRCANHYTTPANTEFQGVGPQNLASWNSSFLAQINTYSVVTINNLKSCGQLKQAPEISRFLWMTGG